FYQAAGDKNKLAALEQQQNDQNMLIFIKFGCIVFAGLFFGFIGLIVDIVQLILLGRRVTPKDQEELVKAPANYGFKAVYAVFVFWFSTVLVCVSLVSKSVGSLIAANRNVLTSALGTTGLYIFQSALGAIYAYFFAMRPHGVKFLEGVKLRF